MKTSELREMLKGNVDDRVLRVLEAQNNSIFELKRFCMDMSQAIDQTANILLEFAEVLGQFKQDNEKVRELAKGQVGLGEKFKNRHLVPGVEVKSVPTDEDV